VIIAVPPGEGALSFTLPGASASPLADAAISALSAALGGGILTASKPQRIDVGPVWIVAEAPDADSVLGLEPDMARLLDLSRSLRATGVTVFGRVASGDADIEVRSFAPAVGVAEDPVCGSGNGAVAVFRRLHGVAGGPTTYTARQGGRTGRAGRIRVTSGADGEITVGGACVTTIEGRLIA
jgi:PhzF family phenazine biosynthesis protein